MPYSLYLYNTKQVCRKYKECVKKYFFWNCEISENVLTFDFIHTLYPSINSQIFAVPYFREYLHLPLYLGSCDSKFLFSFHLRTQLFLFFHSSMFILHKSQYSFFSYFINVILQFFVVSAKYINQYWWMILCVYNTIVDHHLQG